MELELVYNEETQEWEQKPEPFITIECETEEDFEFIGTAVAFYKKHLEEQEKPQTNADRIRAMSDREIAEFLSKKFTDLQAEQLTQPTATHLSAIAHTWFCAWMQWLQQPAEEG